MPLPTRTGNLELDRDIICPCDYRDPDVAQYGACYCRLYVNKAVYESQNLPEVPERRPSRKNRTSLRLAKRRKTSHTANSGCTRKTATPNPAKPAVKKKLWYCKQCGYVVYREDPPYVCPICKAKREMFAEIEANVEFKG